MVLPNDHNSRMRTAHPCLLSKSRQAHVKVGSSSESRALPDILLDGSKIDSPGASSDRSLGEAALVLFFLSSNPLPYGQ